MVIIETIMTISFTEIVISVSFIAFTESVINIIVKEMAVSEKVFAKKRRPFYWPPCLVTQFQFVFQAHVLLFAIVQVVIHHLQAYTTSGKLVPAPCYAPALTS